MYQYRQVCQADCYCEDEKCDDYWGQAYALFAEFLYIGAAEPFAVILKGGQVVAAAAIDPMPNAGDDIPLWGGHLVTCRMHRRKGLGIQLKKELIDYIESTIASCGADIKLGFYTIDDGAKQMNRKLGLVPKKYGSVEMWVPA